MKFRFLIITCVIGLSFYSCKKQVEGFLSDKLFYRTNPFPAIKGRVTTSSPIETDGSTQPLSVELLDIRDVNGKTSAVLTTEYDIAVYKAEIRSTDTTLEMLNKKLGIAKYKPFNVNPIGGRLEVTPASVYADTGTYEFDIRVSNVAGTRTFNKIGKVRLTAPVAFQIVGTPLVSTSTAGQETTVTNLPSSSNTVTVTRKPDGPNKVIIKYIDKNGVVFNPKSGQVIPRISLPTNVRSHFAQFDPYYPVELTDTAFVHQYPEKTPTFPLFTRNNNNYLNSYRIPNTFNDLNLNVNAEFAVRLYPVELPYVSGTYVITYKLNTIAKK
jgi:hypothetical protein